MFTSKALLDTAIEMAPEEPTTLLQKWINHGNHTLNAAFNRYWNRQEKTTSLVANQRYYQLPEDAIKVISVKITMANGTVYVLTPVDNEDTWNILTSSNNSYPRPVKYFQKGADEIGIHPMPTTAVMNGLSISYLPRSADFRFVEYTTGTVTVTNGSPIVTVASGTFLPQVVGMSFKSDDGTHDYWYRINEFTDSTHIKLENNYAGANGGGKAFIIGEIPIIPDEYHENILDYAMYRHSQKQGNKNDADDFMALFTDAKTRLQQDYATSTQNQVIHTDSFRRVQNYDPLTGEPNLAHY
jgi:hypothetical protein